MNRKERAEHRLKEIAAWRLIEKQQAKMVQDLDDEIRRNETEREKNRLRRIFKKGLR
mgnify:CR=1 FL=1